MLTVFRQQLKKEKETSSKWIQLGFERLMYNSVYNVFISISVRPFFSISAVIPAPHLLAYFCL
jgi:hypothetical protein